MQYFLVFTLLFTHPLENWPFLDIGFLGNSTAICKDNKYISPIYGIIEEIIRENNKFTVKISNDFTEIILVGLDCVYKDVGEEIKTGDEIGEDNGITIYTEFAVIQYNNATVFPQFNNNKLFYKTNGLGAAIYSMEPGIVSVIDYDDNNGRGIYLEITNNKESGTISKIQYWHLLSSGVRVSEIVDNTKRIGYVGNTGLSIEPHLTVFFANYIFDLKAVYVKSK